MLAESVSTGMPVSTAHPATHTCTSPRLLPTPITTHNSPLASPTITSYNPLPSGENLVTPQLSPLSLMRQESVGHCSLSSFCSPRVRSFLPSTLPVVTIPPTPLPAPCFIPPQTLAQPFLCSLLPSPIACTCPSISHFQPFISQAPTRPVQAFFPPQFEVRPPNTTVTK